MREVNIRNLDLNLIHPLRALLEERHVSRAAKRLYMSQSAMSRALEKLRETFRDPLLVRNANGYERTSRAERLLKDLESLMPRLEDILRGEQFDPARSKETFRVAMTDHPSMIVLPTLVASVRKAATQIKLEVSPFLANTYEDVATGRINTALCAEEAIPSLEFEKLFELDFVCLAGSGVRLRSSHLTLEQYLKLLHAIVEVRDRQQPLVERALAQLGVKREVVLTLPYFVPAIYAIARTDLIVTVPRRLANVIGRIPGMRTFEPPPEIKSFPYFMAWHPRLTKEPAHAWFRQQVRAAARAGL